MKITDVFILQHIHSIQEMKTTLHVLIADCNVRIQSYRCLISSSLVNLFHILASMLTVRRRFILCCNSDCNNYAVQEKLKKKEMIPPCQDDDCNSLAAEQIAFNLLRSSVYLNANNSMPPIKKLILLLSLFIQTWHLHLQRAEITTGCCFSFQK